MVPGGGGWFRILLALITIALIVAGVVAGSISYRNWRSLSDQSQMSRAEGRGREEFMALSGFVISVSLVFGMVLFALPVLMLDVCRRIR